MTGGPNAVITRGRIWNTLRAAGLDDVTFLAVARVVDTLDVETVTVLAGCDAATIIAAVLGHKSARS